MRLIRFYRSFSELNGYSDEECAAMIWQAKARRADAMWIIPLAVIGAVTLPVLVLGYILARVVTRTSGLATTASANTPVAAVWLGVFLTLAILSTLIWIWVRRALIIRSVLNHLTRAQCPYCLFSLEGLVLQLGSVVCPECGQRIILADEGLTPQDIQPRSTSVTWTPAREQVAELPSIPLEPSAPPDKRKKIRQPHRIGDASSAAPPDRAS